MTFHSLVWNLLPQKMHKTNKIVHSSPSSENFPLPHHYFIWINWLWIRILEGKKPYSELDMSLHKKEERCTVLTGCVSEETEKKRSDSNPSKSARSPGSQIEHKMNIACLGNSKCSTTVLRRILMQITRRKTNGHAECGWNMHWTNAATSFEWHTSLWCATSTAGRGYGSVKPCLF